MDETDSGLDIDALRVVADGVNALRSPERAFIVITHYQRLLELHRAGFRARDVEGPDRRAPAARSWRWSSRNAATPTMRARRLEATDDRPADPYPHQGRGSAGKPFRARSAGDDPMRDIRATAFDAFIAHGPAAPAHRGLEIHRPPRADDATPRRRRSRRRLPRRKLPSPEPMCSRASIVAGWSL